MKEPIMAGPRTMAGSLSMICCRALRISYSTRRRITCCLQQRQRPEQQRRRQPELQ